jgi:hypothetical protein
MRLRHSASTISKPASANFGELAKDEGGFAPHELAPRGSIRRCRISTATLTRM